MAKTDAIKATLDKEPSGDRLGYRVARARQEAHLTEKQLADRLGLPLWKVERLQNGNEDPRTLLPEIADATGKPPQWFLTDEELSGQVNRAGPGEPGYASRFRTVAKDVSKRLSRLRPKSEVASDPGAKSVEQEVVGARVARARLEAGLSQKTLGALLDVPLWRVERIERGGEDAATYLPAIAARTGRDERWFIELVDGSAATALDGGLERATTEPWSSVQLDASADRAAPAPSPDRLRRNLVLACLVLLVTVRFFTEVVHILPRPAKLVDIPVFVLLLVAAVAIPRSSSRWDRSSWYAIPGGVFLVIWAISILSNLGRVAPGPAALFLYGFLAPLGVYYAVYQLWPTGNALSLSRVLVGLATLQFVVAGLIDLPRFLATHNPDVMTGTFGENGYQLVFFLLVTAALVAGIYTFEKGRLAARFAPFFLAATLITILLVQYRALLLTMALTVLLIATLLGFIRLRGAVAVVLIAVTFGLSLSYISSLYPQLKYASTIDTLVNNPTLYISKRIGVLGPIGNLYTDDPRFIVTGTGPGTFSSRAWYLFQPAAKSKAALGVNTSGGQGYQTDVSKKYVTPRLTRGIAESIGGSYAVTSPFSSYASPLAEVGVFGFLAIMAIYFGALLNVLRMTIRSLRRPVSRDPLTGLLLGCTAGFFVLVQMAILENWLEVTRLTFILWALFAVVSKEFAARYSHGA